MNSKVRLLVRADDAGSSWSSNMGCFQACTEGIAQSIEVMMPCAWVSHAADLFGQRSDIDVGIHLTLTSEWDAVKWPPLTHAPSLTDKNGDFFPLVMPRDEGDLMALAQADWSIDEIASEFNAQIALGIAKFCNVSHVSSHMLKHFKNFHPKVGEVVADLCLKFGLEDDAFGYGLPHIEGYPKFPRNAEHRTAAFMNQLSELAEGTYIFIDHPAVGTAELNATSHERYEDVAADRTTCLQTLTSSTLKKHINALGIELVSYREL